MPLKTYRTVDVSIVIVNQNQGVFLERCIRSCLAQTFPGRFHEVFVVDAASTDFSREVIQSYGRKIQPVFLEQPAGIEEAIASGLRRTNNSRYVLTVRAQDFLADYMILFQSIWLFQNHDHEGVYADYWMVERETDTKLHRVSGKDFPCFYGTMYRKEALVKEGLYQPSAARWEPQALQEQLASKHRIGHLTIPFYRYQQDEKVTARPAERVGEEAHRR